MFCPKCKTVELRSAGRGGTPITRCYQCHGMWLRRDEVESLALAGPINDPYSMLPRKADAPVDDPDGRVGLCPEGHGILQRARVQVEQPFYVERCAQCQGLWFDAGEWQELASQRLVGEIERFFDPDWQRAARHQRIEEGHRARIAQLVGEDLVNQLDATIAAVLQHPQGREAAGYLKQRLKL